MPINYALCSYKQYTRLITNLNIQFLLNVFFLFFFYFRKYRCRPTYPQVYLSTYPQFHPYLCSFHTSLFLSLSLSLSLSPSLSHTLFGLSVINLPCASLLKLLILMHHVIVHGIGLPYAYESFVRLFLWFYLCYFDHVTPTIRI